MLPELFQPDQEETPKHNFSKLQRELDCPLIIPFHVPLGYPKITVSAKSRSPKQGRRKKRGSIQANLFDVVYVDFFPGVEWKRISVQFAMEALAADLTYLRSGIGLTQILDVAFFEMS